MTDAEVDEDALRMALDETVKVLVREQWDVAVVVVGCRDGRLLLFWKSCE